MALTVELPVFDGPLDLLLHLIDKNKINIFDIPIVEITEQYLAYVREMEQTDLGVMSEFMVMAAELIAIKCRMLLPPDVDEVGEEIDPREELVAQLLEYKMYKYMSYELRDRMEDASRRLYKPDTTPKEVLSFRPEIDPAELTTLPGGEWMVEAVAEPVLEVPDDEWTGARYEWEKTSQKIKDEEPLYPFGFTT